MATWFGVLVCIPLLASPSLSTEESSSSKLEVRGKLVICGGGALPEEVFHSFRELAGSDDPLLVVVPTASSRADRDGSVEQAVKLWKSRGFERIRVLHTRDRSRADSPPFVAPLKDASAVWFGGGAQSRIAEAYRGTRFEKELYKLLQRGGVIGGSSAGAAIMSKVMIASGNPVPVVKAGFDLLPRTVIDQHFLRRRRQPLLRKVIQDHPQLTGIGIDEGTALVVSDGSVKVVGRSSVTVMRLDGQQEIRERAWQVGQTSYELP